MVDSFRKAIAEVTTMMIAQPIEIADELTLTAPQTCPHDKAVMWIRQHRVRTLRTLSGAVKLTLRDTECQLDSCAGKGLIYRPYEEPLLALPDCSFGLDLVLKIGTLRVREGWSFPRIHAYLQKECGVPIGSMTVQYLHRNYLALINCQVGATNGTLRQRLRKQGAILPIIDGIQFGEGDPVLYLIIDALSRQPLFGQEMVCRGAKDLTPFIRQLKTLEIPILAVISDKERGLVPAIEEALGKDVPHQYCQQHYIGNVAKKLEPDLKTLGEEVRQTESKLRELERDLTRIRDTNAEADKAIPTDLPVAMELCKAARAEARRHARGPYQPPALKRHEGLERVASAVGEARRKKKDPGCTWCASKTY